MQYLLTPNKLKVSQRLSMTQMRTARKKTTSTARCEWQTLSCSSMAWLTKTQRHPPMCLTSTITISTLVAKLSTTNRKRYRVKIHLEKRMKSKTKANRSTSWTKNSKTSLRWTAWNFPAMTEQSLSWSNSQGLKKTQPIIPSQTWCTQTIRLDFRTLWHWSRHHRPRPSMAITTKKWVRSLSKKLSTIGITQLRPVRSFQLSQGVMGKRASLSSLARPALLTL